MMAAAMAGSAASLAALSSPALRRFVAAASRCIGRVAVWLRKVVGPRPALSSSGGGRWVRRHAPTAIAGTIVAVPIVGLVASPALGIALAVALALVRDRRAARASAARDRAARSLAQALAASLAAGNSVHGALIAAPTSVDTPLRPYLDRAARELALGFAVDRVLELLAERAAAPRVRVIVGALAMQRRAGGDLVRLLGELAESFRRDDQALDRARGATTQARLTAWIVIGAPFGVALVAELAWRGALTGVFAVPAALAVFAFALAAHALGAWLVVRLAGVRA